MTFLKRSLIIDVYWAFILPFFCFFSIVTNGINILVFFKIKSRDIIYKYMLFNSIADEAYLCGVFFIFLVKCGQFCQIKDTYAVQIYYKYVYMYATNSIALFSIFLEIIIIVQRYSTLKNRKLLTNVNRNLCLLCFLIFCFIYQLPQLSLFEIEQRNQTTNYTTKFVASDKSFLKRNLLAMQRLVRLVLCFIIIFLLFKLSKISFKKYEAFQLRITNNMQVSTRKRENSSFKKSKLSILLTRPFYFLFLINLLLKRQIDFY